MNKIIISAAGGTYNITEEMGKDIILYSASQLLLSNDITIAYSDTPYETQTLNIYMMCSFGTTAGVRGIRVLGTSYQHILFNTQNAMKFTAIYLNSAWKLYATSNNVVPELTAKMEDAESLTVVSNTSIDLSYQLNRQRFTINGDLSIGADFSLTHTSTPRDGQYFEFLYNATVAYTSSAVINILGKRALTAQEAITGNLLITALYTTEQGWNVKVLGETIPLVATTDVLTFDVSLTNTNTKALNRTPQIIIDGSTGKIPDILSIYAQKIGTTQYATNTTLQVYSFGSSEIIYSNASLLLLGANAVQGFGVEAIGDTGTLLSGADIMIKLLTGDATGGGTDNGVRIFGTYCYLDV